MDGAAPTCSEHDRGVAGVGAAGDGGDDHRAVAQRVLFPVELEGHSGAVTVGSHLETFETLLEMSREEMGVKDSGKEKGQRQTK